MSQEILGKNGIKIKNTTQVEVPWEKLDYPKEYLDSVGKDGLTGREHMNNLTGKFVNANTKEEKLSIFVKEASEGDGHIKSILEAQQVADIIKTETSKGNGSSLKTHPLPMQGGIRPSSQGLHTLTARELVQQAQQRDPTQPYFDTNSDHMAQIDPLAPRTVYSGEGVKTVNPLKPGPTISNFG